MTTYFVTGATGFIGSRLVRSLLTRPDCDTVYVLVREASRARLRSALEGVPAQDRVTEVIGDLTEPNLGISAARTKQLSGRIDHFIHSGASYDMTAGEQETHAANVLGTRYALDFATATGAGVFHHVSSIAVAGDHKGRFSEQDFDLGQRHTSPYHRTKFGAELAVREQTALDYRVYRPAAVVGDSATGEMDKADGPYYFLPIIAGMARLPQALPIIAPNLGATNVVPVDYVVNAMEHLIHQPADRGTVYHLVSPRPQQINEIYNAFARAAGAPQIYSTPKWISAAAAGLADAATGQLAKLGAGRGPIGVRLSDLVHGLTGVPLEVLPYMTLPTVFTSASTRRALADSGLKVPSFDSYAEVLYQFWAQKMDDYRARRSAKGRPLAGRKVVITGASSGIGRATALAVAAQDAVPLLVARRVEELETLRAEIEKQGGTAYIYPCDLTDGEAVQATTKQMLLEHDGIDMLVNNAGRSIRRSALLASDRMHDYERTMAINYFGPVRLVLALLPHMTERHFGHIVNVTTAGLQTRTPRFSAYLASKAALDMFAEVVGTETLSEGVTFTNIRMPLVRTDMIAPTGIYKRFPALSSEEAADLVIEALVKRPTEVNRFWPTVAATAYSMTPQPGRFVLNALYRLFPESKAALAEGDKQRAQTEMGVLATTIAKAFRGVYW
ncbi:SDR family oxidoreductase [Pseudonocardiaceae bacterium YIM PH 21723]|nr:SDR family oxidoreductase [Pseudonocardiaceae bacterium YIM PH 21723]